VYAHPANRYVAGFMGYRNLLSVRVSTSDDGTASVVGEGFTLTGLNRDGLREGEAVAAFRPTDVTVVTEEGENTLGASVEVVEYHGREQAVEARLPSGEALHVRTESRLAPGDDVLFRVPRERVLVFAP
jgi:putative spermidine/putrescine transport system ATP-binding protein